MPLPPPDQAELEAVLKRLLQRLRRLFEGLEARWLVIASHFIGPGLYGRRLCV